MFATHRNRVRSLSAVVTIVWACVMWSAPHALADPLDGVSDTASDAGDAASDATSGAGDAVAGATEDASNAVDEAGEAAGDAVSDVADTTDEVTGGATGEVTDPVEDALNETEETVEQEIEDVGDTVDGVLDGSTDPGNVLPGGGGSPTTEPGSGGHRAGKPNQSRQPVGTGASTAGTAPDVLADPHQHWTIAVGSEAANRTGDANAGTRATHRAGSRPFDVADAFAQVTTQPAAAAVGVLTEAAASQGETDGPLEAILKRAAEATRQLAFPLVLTMMVVAFLTIQGRFDRKDPKLSMAPVDSDQDTLNFE